MKVGILTGEEFAFGMYGGFGYVARKTANLLRDLGHDVCLIDVSSRYGRTSSLLEEGIPVHFLINRKIRLGPIEELKIAKNFLSRVPLDAVIAISAYACGKWVYYFKIVSSKIKVVMWIQDVRTDEDWRRIYTVPLCRTSDKTLPLPLLHERYKRLLRKKGLEKSDRIITPAELLKPKIKKIYKIENAELVPNPVPIPYEENIKKQEEPLAIFLGRLDPIKRPWIYAEIARKLPNVQFLFLGTSHFPQMMNPIMERYKEIKNLKFLGLTLGREKAEILSKAWVLINSSIHEALPMSFEEALSYKMAILSCHNPDTITSDYGSYTGQPLGYGHHEIPRFVEGLQYLLSNSRWKEKGEKGYEFIRRFADAKKIEKRIDQILTSL